VIASTERHELIGRGQNCIHIKLGWINFEHKVLVLNVFSNSMPMRAILMILIQKNSIKLDKDLPDIRLNNLDRALSCAVPQLSST
jgi:hypothetical protein